jgi:hypothetical protein
VSLSHRLEELRAIILAMSKEKPVWKKHPEQADYTAATDFLSLLFPKSQAQSLVRALRRVPLTQRSARDLLRASGLPLLPPNEASVKQDLKKIAKGKPMSPVLLICGDMAKGRPLIVADGYHRICAVCHYDEFSPVATQMVET